MNGSGNVSWSLNEIGAAAVVNRRIVIPATTDEVLGATLKSQKESGSVTDQETWLTDKPDNVIGHKAIGIRTSIGPVYWNGSGLRRIYNEDFKPTAADVKALPITGGTLTGNLTAPDVLVSSAQNTSVNALTRKDYVDSAIAAGDALQVSKTGDTMTGGLTFANAASELGWVFNTDYAKIGFKNTGDTDSYMWFKTGDNGNEYFKWQGVSGANTADWMSLKSTGLVVAAGVTAPTFTGALAGNAATATKLATASQINGTNFDGTDNITTANWGTARTLTIGNSGKSVNGSVNVSWSLSEIGAARARG